jgi:YVTN family beta-propeller protein
LEKWAMKNLKINKGAVVLVVAVILAITFGGIASAAEKETSYKLIKKIPINSDGGWDYLTVDSKVNRLYISHQTHVVVFDTASEKVIGDINNTPGVHGIATAHAFNKGFISNGGDNSVTVFDLATLKETGRIKVSAKPDAIMFDHATKRIFVFNGGSKDCNVIDANTNKIIGSISLDGKPEFAVEDEKGRVFVNLEDKSEIAVIDAQKMIVTNRWSIAPGEAPTGLAIDRKNMRLFSVCANGKMVVVDYNSGKVIATPEIGKGPDAAGFDHEAGLAFSSNGQDGTLTIVNEETPMQFKVVQTVTTAPLARTMAVNSKTHLVYLVTAKLKPPVPGQEQSRKKSYEPGTFELLIVGPSEK